MKTRCFFISVSWRDQVVSHHFRALSRELAVRGHRVVLIVDQQNRAVEDHTSNPAIYTWPSKRPTNLADACFLSRLMKELRPDCLVANNGSVTLMLLVGWFYGIQHRLAWYHTMTNQVTEDELISPLRLAFLRFRKRVVYRCATGLVAVSHSALEDLKRVFRIATDKCRVFHNALADPFPGQDIRKKPSGECRVVCAGRFNRSKGQDVLIRALALLRQDLPGVSVEFLGDGPTRPECERLARELGVKDSCRFIGTVTHQELLNAMSRADMTVVPSRSEAFGLVALESLAVATPVVASDVGGLREIIQDGRQGRLVPGGDAAALAEGLRVSLSDLPAYSQMSEQARMRFLSSFEQRRAIQAQIDWLESLS